MICVEHLLSDGRGSAPLPVLVCRACERVDPDLRRLREKGRLPWYHGISRGKHRARRCEHPDHGGTAVAPGRPLSTP